MRSLVLLAMLGAPLAGLAQAPGQIPVQPPVQTPMDSSPSAPTDKPASAWADVGGELRLTHTAPQANPLGPLAQAHALLPSVGAPPATTDLAEAELRGRWRFLSANVLLNHERPKGDSSGSGHSQARFNELHASADLGAWQLSAGKKVVSWDVGYGFRPNDVVQQEVRRSLLSNTLEGRPLLQAEYFGAQSATSVVWVQPQHANQTDAQQRGAEESALAARFYQRHGALDAYGFARLGQHTGASLGAAAAWVASDELELHASLRWMQRFDGWQWAAAGNASPSSAALASANPWQLATQQRASQALLGGQWTGAQQQSLMLEAWHDGSAPSAAQWRQWQARNAGLAELAGPPPAAVAGNLAWQASPLGGVAGSSNLQRNNVYARLAWQPEPWQLTLDALWHPADDGLISSAGLQWQGDAWKLSAAWRHYGGPRSALVRQLPSRQLGVVALSRAF